MRDPGQDVLPQGALVRMVDAVRRLRHAIGMLVRTITHLHRAVLLTVLAVALVATGFAHRMPTPQDDALVFALANGATLDDFCGDQPGTGVKDPHCLACQIAGTADLPRAQGLLVDLELAFVARVIAPRESRAIARALDPANSPQGPPAA